MKAIRESISALKAGDGISIFPEGTRHAAQDNSMQEIKGGVTLLAIKGNAPIVPMIINKPERIFRKNYIYIGEPFDLTEFQGKLLDGETISEASDKVAAHMQKAKDDMAVFIAEKRWKVQKKEHKAFLKTEKKMNKTAKRDYKLYLRSRKKA